MRDQIFQRKKKWLLLGMIPLIIRVELIGTVIQRRLIGGIIGIHTIQLIIIGGSVVGHPILPPLRPIKETNMTTVSEGTFRLPNRPVGPADPSAFMNYEIIIVELALVIHPKTEIISEAPYGIGIIFITLISVAIIKLGKRRDYSEI